MEEEEEEEFEENWLENARAEVVEYILRKFGMLSARDIAKILNWKIKEVNFVLKQLESFGKIRKTKLGKTLAWSPIETHVHNPMYY
ncbi:MAG: hypothetical protein ACK4GQ_01055 [Candidatus Hadarchaeales archaeon]